MVGRGSRSDEGSFTVSSSNVFAALESLRKKKKGVSKGSKAGAKGDGKLKEVEEEKQVYWAPAPLTAKSWADVDDEDDDDYYSTTAPPQAIWGGSSSGKAEELNKPDLIEESESEDEILDEDDDAEDEHDHDLETNVQQQDEPPVKEPVELPPARKEAERQLSKKERKKKELAELDAILAHFGVNPQEKAEDEQSETLKDRNEKQLNGDEDKKNTAATEFRTKKKKNKDKASKDAKDFQDQPNTSNAPVEHEGGEQADDTVDVKERLKKVTLAKKKKSTKEMDGAARAVAFEAAARNAKLAAAKKKEKSHYNQQPTR